MTVDRRWQELYDHLRRNGVNDERRAKQYSQKLLRAKMRTDRKFTVIKGKPDDAPPTKSYP